MQLRSREKADDPLQNDIADNLQPVPVNVAHLDYIFIRHTFRQRELASVGIEVNLLKKIRLEIAVNDNFVERTVRAIIDGAKTGQIGDGKIFILDLPECIRIRTEERGGEAIG